jgi:hypothetical protein
MNARTDIVVPETIGSPFEGGILLGRYFLDTQARALIGASKVELARPEMAWNSSMKRVAGAQSIYDGLANTEAMLAAGSAAAKWARDLRLGGFDDWHLAARGQALLAFDANSVLPDAEKFDEEWHWTSTQYAGDERWAWCQNFDYGGQGSTRKDNELRLFAVRSVAI